MFGGEKVMEAWGLTKVYGRGEGRVEALVGATFEVEAGEWVSVVGPSGSGKSTLMNLLGLLDRPTSGSYVLNGRGVAGSRGYGAGSWRGPAATPSGRRWC